jgi:hypothetical protein
MDLVVLSLAAMAGLIFGFWAVLFRTGFHRAAGITLILATLPVVLGFAFFFDACSGDTCDDTWIGVWADVIEIAVLTLLALSALLGLMGFAHRFRRRRTD